MSSPETGRSAPEAAHSLGGRLLLATDRITMALNVIGTLLIVAMMVLVNADVIGRGMFNAPISGVPELVSMSIVAVVFLQVAQTFRSGRLTRTDALLAVVRRRAPRLRAAIEFVYAVLALFIMGQLLMASTPLFVRSWQRNTFEGTIGDFTAPIWPVKLIILIGCTALMVQLFITALMAAKTAIRGEIPSQEGADEPF